LQVNHDVRSSTPDENIVELLTKPIPILFCWGENCADEVDDWAFYEQKFSAGVAFTKERLTVYVGLLV